MSNADTHLAQVVEQLRHEDGAARLEGVKALGEIGSPEVAPYLIDALTDEDEAVRYHAARTLGIIADPRAVPHLADRLLDQGIDTLQEGPPHFVAEAAAIALTRIGTPQALAALDTWPDRLLDEIYTDDYVRCFGAVIMLGRLKDERAVPRMRELLQGGADKLAADYVADLDPASQREWSRWLARVTVEALENITAPEARAAVQEWRTRQQGNTPV